MPAADIDAYIAKAQPFAVPILERVRHVVRAACPDTEEALKWGAPHFVYRGKNLCLTAGFKGHAILGFLHSEMVTGKTAHRMEAMGSVGRLKSIDDLPDEATLTAWVVRQMQLIDDGVKPPHLEGRGKHPKPEIAMVPAFQTALNANAAAKANYDGFPPSCRREYLEWIADAKREETRDKRIAQAIIWIADGKKRNWKYENC
ncbi:YdeI/OmpD-associated family protein [Sphingorhabdus sp.]|jgi:uncharacterized protein YdeI (YjbR/CyaY-like superfamily)|uniref:YdeI/OmpD-associated family protein n=1 Tax=Sphingorhabdus sp. TaxID=1902408 RepID=UPI003BB10618|nr:YdeI/OmpD-associated family protein [Sphingomonadales bacterium]MBK9431067.1 YdeI/OmpD-associated family protein [Sphingomonadales bacterium]MBL0021204.1 YdeI/OmpD-associated family protein [Sphingomonadales bacterium]